MNNLVFPGKLEQFHITLSLSFDSNSLRTKKNLSVDDFEKFNSNL
jgi:hypothetical protein